MSDNDWFDTPNWHDANDPIDPGGALVGHHLPTGFEQVRFCYDPFDHPVYSFILLCSAYRRASPPCGGRSQRHLEHLNVRSFTGV